MILSLGFCEGILNLAIGCLEIVELLLGEGDDVNAECADKKTALHYAAQMGHEAIVNRLLSVNGKELVNCPDIDSWTPLHYAAEHGSLQLVHTFLEVEFFSALSNTKPAAVFCFIFKEYV